MRQVGAMGSIQYGFGQGDVVAGLADALSDHARALSHVRVLFLAHARVHAAHALYAPSPPDGAVAQTSRVLSNPDRAHGSWSEGKGVASPARSPEASVPHREKKSQSADHMRRIDEDHWGLGSTLPDQVENVRQAGS